MAGVKGRSGRRPLRDEEKRLKIIDKAWDIIKDHFDDPNLSTGQKLKQAIQIIVKDMPQQVEGMEMNNVVIMSEIKKAQDTVRYDIGNANASEDTRHTEETPPTTNRL